MGAPPTIWHTHTPIPQHTSNKGVSSSVCVHNVVLVNVQDREHRHLVTCQRDTKKGSARLHNYTGGARWHFVSLSKQIPSLQKKKNQIHVKWHVRLFVYKWHNPTFFCHPEVRPCEILAKMSADATIRLAEAKIYVKTHNNATQRSRINTKKSHCIRSQALRINHTANLGVLFACSFLSWHMGR